MSGMPSEARLTVLISGNGSNLQALIDTPCLRDARIVRVISNRKAARGLERAAKASIPTHYHNLVPYAKTRPSSDPSVKYSVEAREAYDADLARLIQADEPDLVVCAGWMHILSEACLAPLEEAGVPVINLHPALPGEFNGADAIERAWQKGRDEGLKRTGVMIHYVIGEVDCGEPVVTEEVELREHESLEQLETRMHEVEHRLIVEGTRIALEKLRPKRNSSKDGAVIKEHDIVP